MGIIVILAILDWFSQFTAHTNLDKQVSLFIRQLSPRLIPLLRKTEQSSILTPWLHRP